jgi:Domain of unknown function (DUF5068)/Domain of unknown function (DUF4352)
MRKVALSLVLGASILTMAACGEEAKEPASETTTVTEKKEETKKEETKSGEFLNPELATLTGGKVESVLSTKLDKVFDGPGVKITVEAYDLVKITDITNLDNSFHFEDKKEGYAVTMKVKVENKSDKTAFISDYSFNLKNSKKNLGAKLFPASQKSLGNKNSQLPAGESWEGVLTYPMSENVFNIMTSDPVNFHIDAITEDGKSSNVLLPKNQIPIALNAEGQKQVASAAGQYPDEIVQRNYGTKEVLKEQKDLNITNDFDGLQLTVNGIQYAKVTPDSQHARLFTDFKDGINSVTVKIDVKNNSQFDFDSNDFSPWLITNNSTKRQKQSTIIEDNSKTIKKGEQKTIYVNFLMNKLDYDGLSKIALNYTTFFSSSAGKTVIRADKDVELPFQK